MRLVLKTKQQKWEESVSKLSGWHKKFVWKPTRMSNDPTIVVWGEFVLRRGKCRNGSFLRGPREKAIWDWEYVESTFDVLKMKERY